MDSLPDLPIAPLKRLARGLLYDEARADDVVQEAWLAALRRDLAPEGLRRWLAEAVRRIARSTGRDELRRARREERAARPEALPSAAEASERIEILRKLLDAVDALDEPYRTAVVLRYFDELPPRVIAEQLGVPVNTARTHVRRGVERLRRELDGEHGRGREAFLAALVPFAGEVPWRVALGGPALPSMTPVQIGVLVAKSPAVLAVLLVLGLGAAWFLTGDANEGEERVAARSVPPANASSSEERSRDPLVSPGNSQAAREPTSPDPQAPGAAWTVRGHVFRGRREPYAGAQLAGLVYAGASPTGTPLLDERFLADEHGDFAWPIAPPEELVTVLVEPVGEGLRFDGASDVFLPGDLPPERWTVSAFPLDGWLRGVVRDPQGKPVADARVLYERFPEPEGVQTDSEGRFAVETASTRDLDLWFYAEGFAPERVALERPIPGEQTRDVVLAPEHRLHGRVVDETGSALEGVLVSASFPPELAGTRTDAAGRFELGSVPGEDAVFGDQVILALVKDGFPSSRQAVARARFGEELELRLEHGARLAGRVLAPDGAPVASAYVSVGFSSYRPDETYTDAEGRFELGPAAAGTQELWVWRTGFAQLRHDLEVPAGVARVDGIELRPAPPHFLGGTVLDERGRPMPWVFVSAHDPDRSDEHLNCFWTHTDAAGRFRFDGLPAVPVNISAQEPGFAPLEEDVPALDRDDLVLRMRAGARLTGRVVAAASGEPLRSFTLRIQRSKGGGDSLSWIEGLGFAPEDGVWALDEDFQAGEDFLVTASAPGYAARFAPARASVGARPEDCVIQLARGARVRGRVVEGGSGRALAGARVRASSLVLRAIRGYPLPETRTDEEGRFELADLAPGEWTLAIESEGLGAVDGPFTVAGTETLERWIELGSGGRIGGRLLDAKGNGLAGETVSLWGAEVVGGLRDWSATTTSDGSYELSNLPAGIFQLQWLRELEGKLTKDLEVLVTLAGGEERRIDLQPRGRATVRGTVGFTGGALPAVVPLYLYPRRESPHRWADGLRGGFAVDGRFEVTHLEPGSWTVMAIPAVDDGSIPQGSVEVVVPSEGSVEAHIVIEPRD